MDSRYSNGIWWRWGHGAREATAGEVSETDGVRFGKSLESDGGELCGAETLLGRPLPMMCPLQRVLLALAILGVCPFVAFSHKGLTQAAFQPLASLLREVPGWQGDLLVLELDADGGGGALGKSYVRGDAVAEIRVLVGPEVKSYLGGMLPGVALMENAALRLERFSEGSFDVVLRREKSAVGGTVVVLLGSDDRGALVVEYERISSDEALALAREFDWRGMAERLPGGAKK